MKYLKLAVLVVFLLWAGKTSACKCAPPPEQIKNVKELAQYDFIAHVKMGELTVNADSSTGQWAIQVVEKFKGGDLSDVYDRGFNTDCRLSFKPGDEWLLFGKYIDGKLVIFRCDRSMPYRLVDGRNAIVNNHQKGDRMLVHLRELYKR